MAPGGAACPRGESGHPVEVAAAGMDLPVDADRVPAYRLLDAGAIRDGADVPVLARLSAPVARFDLMRGEAGTVNGWKRGVGEP